MAPVAKKRPVTKPTLISTNQFTQGTVFTDVIKRQWVLGAAIGQGGFGVIYLARAIGDPKTEFNYVMKVEPFANGPLYCETNCYIRVAKSEMIEEWKTSHKVPYFGMPRFVANGNHEDNREKYRFLVMDRFGQDLHRELSQHPLLPASCFKIALRVVDVLEYMHSKGYVHADIKALNILKGHHNQNEIYLVDFGLAHRYFVDDKHREEKPDPKWRHNGTQEFCARDSHNALQPSRRGDLESLGYNLLFWLGHRLPWEYFIGGGSIGIVRNGPLSEKIKTQISESKRKNMMDPKALVKELKLSHIPELIDYMTGVNALAYAEEPNYTRFRGYLRNGLKRVATGKEALDERILQWDSGAAPHAKPKAGSKRKSIQSPQRSRSPSPSPPKVTKRKIGRPAANGQSKSRARGGKKLAVADEEDTEEIYEKENTVETKPAGKSRKRAPATTKAAINSQKKTPISSASSAGAANNIIPGLQPAWKPASQRSATTPIDKSKQQQRRDHRQSASCQTSPHLLLLAKRDALAAAAAAMGGDGALV